VQASDNEASDNVRRIAASGPVSATRRRLPPLKRLLPILVLVAGAVAFFASGAHRYVDFEMLRQHRGQLQDWVDHYTLAALAVYFAVYVVVVAFSLPGGALLTMVGGFLFGIWMGGCVVVFAATAGATILFLAARSAFAEVLRAKTGSAIDRMEKGFRENAMSYLLALRLVPLFPFFVVNLVPAFLDVPLKTFVIATFFGIIPGTLVFASVGNGFDAVIDMGGEPNFGIIYNPEVFGPLVALAALSFLPILYKRYKGRRDS
jgi:uncharacterized membrane protein YdjX (TVP38/TMEM64 family)